MTEEFGVTYEKQKGQKGKKGIWVELFLGTSSQDFRNGYCGNA
jgi:hypothetical protein